MKIATENLLEHHHLRKTKIRLAVLDFMLVRQYALSHAEIESHIDKEFDRVTIYRTLKSFEDQGLVHRVVDDSGTAKYALCSSGCTEHTHFDKHVHFSCTVCGHTYCLENVPIPDLQLPTDYKFTTFNFMAQGVCKNCLKI